MHYVQAKSEIISPLFGVAVPKKMLRWPTNATELKDSLGLSFNRIKIKSLSYFRPACTWFCTKGVQKSTVN